MPAKIKRGDKVVVLAGKDRGKQGTVREVVTKTDRVVVEGVNIVKKHQRARQQGQASQIVHREAPIHISNVMLVDPNSGKPTRVTFRRREDGSLVAGRQAQRRGHRLMPPRMKEKYNAEVAGALREQFGYSNVMQVPKITKVVREHRPRRSAHRRQRAR